MFITRSRWTASILRYFISLARMDYLGSVIELSFKVHPVYPSARPMDFYDCAAGRADIKWSCGPCGTPVLDNSMYDAARVVEPH